MVHVRRRVVSVSILVEEVEQCVCGFLVWEGGPFLANDEGLKWEYWIVLVIVL